METPKFKLYHFPASRSARVKWTLHEVLDDDFEVETVSLYEGEQHRPDYLQKNPNHCVPTLEITLPDGGSWVMLESGAMVTFLADSFPDKGLAPSSVPFSQERADYLQMLYFGASWMDMMLWQIRIHEHLLPRLERDKDTIRRYRTKFTSEVEPQLCARLERHSFICGDAFTAADCVIGHNVIWARGDGLCQHELFGNYLSRVSKRPAFVKAFADARGFQRPEDSGHSERFSG